MKQINEDTPLYSISTAAELLNISVHTLRMYEREGLILPHKKESGHRLYSQSDIDRIKCIRMAINEKKFSIAAIKTMYSMIPCWEIIHCPPKEMASCLAYNGHSNPCWLYMHKDNICEKLNCMECTVYKEYSDCEKIKNGIKSITVLR